MIESPCEISYSLKMIKLQFYGSLRLEKSKSLMLRVTNYSFSHEADAIFWKMSAA